MFDGSVVLPVHAGAAPAHLRRSLESVYQQTLLPAEVIVVEDGPLTTEHNDVLSAYESAVPPIRRITLPVNMGTAAALQAGISVAEHSWIIRMDSDDISVPSRLERQATALHCYGLDVIGCAMSEFEGDENNVVRIRSCPTGEDAIARRMRANNPMNHPTVIYRRDLVMAVGGYSMGVGRLEDYDMFARMLQAGARMRNLNDPLVKFRAGDAMLQRRRSWRMWHDEIQLQKRLWTYGVVSRRRQYFNVVVRIGFRCLPKPLMRAAYACNLV